MIELHPTSRDFRVPRSYWKNPFAPYTPTTVEPASILNSTRLDDLAKGGKIYLSLSDAVVLALENNYDIAIQRFNIDIADTDILRAKAGYNLLGAPSGLVENTIGGTNQLLQASGGGPGGTSAGAGGAGAGASGLTLTTNGLGAQPEVLDPTLTGTIQLQRQTQPTASSFSGPVVNTHTNEYDFEYTQGWITGTELQVGFNNSRTATDAPFTTYSPALQSNFMATVTQHLAYGFGPGINKRLIVQAKNDRHITDSGFRQQVLYTVNQVENIYWGLVSAYEDVQSKQRALDQSTQLASDNRKQLQIGTLAPLDVVQSDSNVASDQQALVASQSALEYQQLVMKQAIARNLTDPTLSSAPVIPTDRISILETPEERTPVDDLVKQANANRPDVQIALLTLRTTRSLFVRNAMHCFRRLICMAITADMDSAVRRARIAPSSMPISRVSLAPLRRHRRSVTARRFRTFLIIPDRTRASASTSIFRFATGRPSRSKCARFLNTARRNCSYSRSI
jgi:outer membrane protein